MAGESVIDPITGIEAIAQVIQPFQATKKYECPGCNQTIEARTGHIVVVPTSAIDLRRHWHRACWEHRDRRWRKA